MTSLSTKSDVPEAARPIITRYYFYSGLYTLSASVIWGVNTLFLLDAGLSITNVFIANAAFSAGTMLFELPTGVVADTIGRRVSFLISIAILAMATLGYVGTSAVGGGVVSFAAISILLGLGFTFYSGAMEAWLVDAVRHHGYSGELDPIFSRSQMVTGASMLVGTVGGGVLGQLDLAVPFLIRSAMLLVLFAAAFTGMHDLGFTPGRVPLRRLPSIAVRAAQHGASSAWGNLSLRYLMVATAIQNGFMAWAWYAWQPYLLELLERDAVWVAGVVAALLAASMMVGNAIVEIVMRWCSRRTTLLLASGATFTVSLAGVGAVGSFPIAVALLFVAGMAMGVQMPVRQAFIHQSVDSAQRATIVSFDSMLSGGAGVAGQAGLGALAERRSFSAGYVLGGAATVCALPMLLLLRRRNDAADTFTGTTVEHTCAAPAVPAMSQLSDGRIEPASP